MERVKLPATGDLAMKKILIVDDEPIPIRLLKRALERAGYEVTAASNGHEAFLRLSESEPDAVITDIEMPRMTGEQLCKKINEEIPDRKFPIFVVTSMTAVEHREWSCELDNLMFLEKPVSIRKLLRKLGEYFEAPSDREVG